MCKNSLQNRFLKLILKSNKNIFGTFKNIFGIFKNIFGIFITAKV
jgi:hypothetical protein